jgi:4-amino-4-deoxy-L-arabinose transferase-like glycosyltransferase
MKRLYFFLVIFLAATGIGLWLWGINDPFVGSYNANNNYLMLASKNYERFGFFALHTLPTYTTSSALPAFSDYYLHHPILFFWIAAFSFRILGYANWTAHVMTGMFALASVFMIYLIGKTVWDKKTAVIAGLCALYFPMSAFFYKFCFFEQITLFLNLIVIYSSIRFIQSKQKKWLAAVGISSFVCMLSDWYGAYLVFPFAYMLLTTYKDQTKRILSVYIPSIIFGFLFFWE